jgi:hypothetical protein
MASLRDMRVLGDFAVENCCHFPGLYFPYNETIT